MRSRNNVEARLHDLAALSSARNADELHKVLVLHPPSAYEREPTLPYLYFCRAHEHDPQSSPTTAMLLITNPRWIPASGPLIARIEASGFVADDDLDLLAHAFAVAGPQLYWTCPEDWFDAETVIQIDEDPATEDVVDLPDDDDPVAVVALPVPAGARRWAVGRLLRKPTTPWSSLLEHAKDLAGPDGAAIMRGLLDRIDSLPPAAAEHLQTESLTWGRADVRLHALQLLAQTHPEIARTRGSSDPNDKIRRWAAASAPTTNTSRPGKTTSSKPTRSYHAEPAGRQPALF